MLITLESLANVPGDVRYAHDVTVANAYLVMDAALRFAGNNDDIFSTDFAGDTDPNNRTLQDYLPNGRLLLNPYMSAEVEPQDGLSIYFHGSVGYLGSSFSGSSIEFFTIEAYDCDGATMLTLMPFSAYGEQVWSAAYRLRAAVEQFATDSGHLPHNLDTETTPAGKTALDLFSETEYEGRPDVFNPYTQQFDIPPIGIANSRGEVAYQPEETAGTVTDYVITGRGALEEIVRLGPKPLN
jgi:hypothetical protein